MKTKGRELTGASAAELLKAQTMKFSSDSRKSIPGSTSSTPPKPSKKRKRGRDSGTSSEEERWLDAIKSGKLEEVNNIQTRLFEIDNCIKLTLFLICFQVDEELKKIKPKDPKMMTARQRAMYERGTDKEPNPDSEVLMALPSGYKEKVMTAESIQKAAIKSLKRKQMADEKREKDKKKTMERLLKKQDSKNVKNTQRTKPQRGNEPTIIYKTNKHETFIALPPRVGFPLEPQFPREYPEPILCGVNGCSEEKRYNCSKTGVPLCSLYCYRENLRANPLYQHQLVQEFFISPNEREIGKEI